CVSPRERRGGARVNEKTTANPRIWPLIGGHLAPQGDGSLDLRCFFRVERCIVRAKFLVLLNQQKYKRHDYFCEMNQCQCAYNHKARKQNDSFHVETSGEKQPVFFLTKN
ncbi:MAG: hypothetical protein KG029_00165, partial [Bacteroidetes bacterium]|nr:hypothetical protein [Bacteroidota bacterium]